VQFKNILGQEETKEKLVGLFHQNRLSHALLFLGKEGNGTLSLARAFAQYILCDKVNGKTSSTANTGLFGEEDATASKDIDVSNDSCGECPSCIKAAKLAHPDIHFTIPTISGIVKTRPTLSSDLMVQWRTFILENPYGNTYDWLQFIDADNKQGNITAEECNDIVRKLNLKSFESGYKILIVWMTELLGAEGNKLLKLIEEPPPQTLFFFVAENEGQILQTILSRTQLVKIPLLKEEDIRLGLINIQEMEASKAQMIAHFCDGNFREAALQLKHSDDQWDVLLRDWLNSILKTGPLAQLKWVEEAAKLGREKQKQFLQYFLHLIDLALRSEFLPPLKDGITLDDKQAALIDFATKLNRICEVAQLEAMAALISESSYQIERNANAKMLFHALTIRLYHIISNKSVILVH
jgi:DNA polymerase-3 subunit delta'